MMPARGNISRCVVAPCLPEPGRLAKTADKPFPPRLPSTKVLPCLGGGAGSDGPFIDRTRRHAFLALAGTHKLNKVWAEHLH